MSVFSDLVDKELQRSRENHTSLASLHEGYAVILEELDEFWDEVKKFPKHFDPRQAIIELVQVAAMARATAEDVMKLGQSDEWKGLWR